MLRATHREYHSLWLPLSLPAPITYFFQLGKISSKIKCQHIIFKLWSVLTSLAKNGYLNVARRILLQCLLIWKLLINLFYETGFPWIWKIIWNLAGSWCWCDNHRWQWYVQLWVQKSGKLSFTCNLMQNCRFPRDVRLSSLKMRYLSCLRVSGEKWKETGNLPFSCTVCNGWMCDVVG